MIDPGYTPPPRFLCPLCGSNQCHFVVYVSPSGKDTRMPWFSCAGCTVMFRDAKRFQVMMRRTDKTPPGSTIARVEEKQWIGKAELPAWQKHRMGGE